MKLHCPHCGVKGSAEDSYSGRKVKCPKCQGIFAVTPDMVSALPEEAPFPAGLSSTLTEPDVLSEETEMMTAEAEEGGEIQAEEVLTTEASPEPGQTDAAPAERAPATEHPVEQEESIDWEDIAAEIDVQLADEKIQDEHEETLAETPPDESSFAEDLENPDAAAEVSAETGREELVQGDAEVDEIELEPYGIDQKQCWQCGKKESVGESFIAKDGRLYCVDCAPIENIQEPAADSKQSQGDEDTPSVQEVGAESTGLEESVESVAKNQADNTSSTGDPLSRIWAKMKKFFRS